MRVESNALPPKERNGRVIPVIGNKPSTAPILINAWIMIQVVVPAANRRPKASGAFKAVDRPVNPITMYKAITNKDPIRPISSAIIA